MSSVTEIEQAIEQLPPDDFTVLRRWFITRDSVIWDSQMDRDAADGRLDFLFDEADKERAEGSLRGWPEVKS
jgi:hypothetical protein